MLNISIQDSVLASDLVSTNAKLDIIVSGGIIGMSNSSANIVLFVYPLPIKLQLEIGEVPPVTVEGVVSSINGKESIMSAETRTISGPRVHKINGQVVLLD